MCDRSGFVPSNTSVSLLWHTLGALGADRPRRGRSQAVLLVVNAGILIRGQLWGRGGWPPRTVRQGPPAGSGPSNKLTGQTTIHTAKRVMERVCSIILPRSRLATLVAVAVGWDHRPVRGRPELLHLLLGGTVQVGALSAEGDRANLDLRLYPPR